MRPFTWADERAELVAVLDTAIAQRDSALMQLNDRTNIAVYADRLKAITTNLREAFEEVDRAVKIVRRLIAKENDDEKSA